MEATKERGSIDEAAERFKTKAAYTTEPVHQYGLPDQCYRDMLQLATAAPDLLAVVKEGVRLYETYGLIAGTGQGLKPGAWVNAAREAIAKTT